MKNNFIIKVNQKAIAQVRTSDDKKVLGYINFQEDQDGNVHIQGNLNGLPPGVHAIHVHTKGDPRNCCEGLGGHYNPFDKPHGGRTIKDIFGKEIINHNRHVGDFSNIEVGSDGTAKFSFVDPIVKLSGPYSIIGRSIVIHSDPDDLGKGSHSDSLTNGHSGKRISYGIIGWA